MSVIAANCARSWGSLSAAVAAFMVWLVLILQPGQENNLWAFSYVALYHCFVPGILLVLSFRDVRQSFSHTLFWGGIFSYLLYVFSVLPLLRVGGVSWRYYLYFLIGMHSVILAVFLWKTFRADRREMAGGGWSRNSVWVVLVALMIAGCFNHVNFRNDSTYYIKRIKDAAHAQQVEFNNYEFVLDGQGAVQRQRASFFIHDWKPYYNYLAIPIRWVKTDVHQAWFLYTKIFIFQALLGASLLARALLGPTGSWIGLLLYVVNILPLRFFYGQSTESLDPGVIFSQMAQPRTVSEQIFLVAFFLACYSWLTSGKSKFLLLSGLMLLAITTQHYVALLLGGMNFVAFSLLALVLKAKEAGAWRAAKGFTKNNLLVFAPPALFFLLVPEYLQKLNQFLFHSDFQQSNPIYQTRILFDKSFFQLLSEICSPHNLMIFVAVFAGSFYLMGKVRNRAGKAYVFLLTNLFVYLALKFPLYNLIFDVSGAVARRLDAGLLSWLIVAVLVHGLLRRAMIRESLVKATSIVLIAGLFAVYGVDAFAADKRQRWNWGLHYLEMTKFLEYFRTQDTKDLRILTNYKNALDIYANLDAYLFQYDAQQYYPFNITAKLDEMVLYPWRNPQEMEYFLGVNKVDYIVLPGMDSGYFPQQEVRDALPRTYDYYLSAGYSAVYQDSHARVFKRILGHASQQR